MTIEQGKTIEMLTNDLLKYEFIIGLILAGSLANDTGNNNSDIDIFVVVSDEEYAKRRIVKNYFCGTLFEQSNYPVYIDGKIINKDYLKRVSTEGNECVKNTFLKTKLLFSKDREITESLKNIDKTNYQKSENIKKFYSLMKNYKNKADDDVANILQVKHSIFNTVFFACRLILEHNNIYYPCLKNMEKEIINCKYKPQRFIENMHELLNTYSFDELEIFYKTTEEYFKEYRFDDNIRKGYVIENEDYWYFNVRPYSEI